MKKILQKFKEIFKNTDDFQLGYEVAKQEFTAYYDVNINMASDLHNFRTELAQDYGEDYALKTESFIEQAVELTHDLPPYLIADPIQVRSIVRLQQVDYRLIHFVKMMVDINISWDQPNKIGIAKAYCKLGMNLLNEDEPYFNTYSKIFDGYQKTIMELEWRRD